jgi:hypothetical protein
MAKPIGLEARASLSKPGRGAVLWDENGPVLDRPDWLSVDVHVTYLLDDDRRVSAPEPRFVMGGPLDCDRHEFEARVRDLIFSEPRFEPGDPRAVPPHLVEELASFGVETTMTTLTALPLTVLPDDAVTRHLRCG